MSTVFISIYVYVCDQNHTSATGQITKLKAFGWGKDEWHKWVFLVQIELKDIICLLLQTECKDITSFVNYRLSWKISNVLWITNLVERYHRFFLLQIEFKDIKYFMNYRLRWKLSHVLWITDWVERYCMFCELHIEMKDITCFVNYRLSWKMSHVSWITLCCKLQYLASDFDVLLEDCDDKHDRKANEDSNVVESQVEGSSGFNQLRKL